MTPTRGTTATRKTGPLTPPSTRDRSPYLLAARGERSPRTPVGASGLSPRDYERFVLPHSAKVFEALASYGVPRVHFGMNTGELLGLMSAAGADVVGVDWRVPLDEAVRRITAAGSGPKPVQGNLDPALLFAGWDAIEPEINRILAEGQAAPGHIFNLGHGVPPDADPEVLNRVVKYVQAKSAHVPA